MAMAAPKYSVAVTPLCAIGGLAGTSVGQLRDDLQFGPDLPAVAADQLDPGLSPPLRRTIERQLASCQEKLPNRGLARRDDP